MYIENMSEYNDRPEESAEKYGADKTESDIIECCAFKRESGERKNKN